jgi:two-component sensor histidine kinase
VPALHAAAEQATLPTGHPLIDYLHRTGQPVLRLEPSSDLPDEAKAWLDQQGIELSIPLIVGGEQVGLYNLGPKLSGSAYNRDEVRLLRLMGQQAAVAVENSRLYEQAQREIVERRRVEERLKASLAEKEILLKEVHHRVKNNLQVISSLLHLQSRQIQDPATLELFLESQHRVKSMALVHERLYQTEGLSGVDCAEYVRELVGYLVRSYSATSSQIKLNVDVDPGSLGIDMAIPCGLIINELVSNSLKHAFPDGREGEILVQFHLARDGHCILVIGDNGVGLPAGLDPGSQASGSLGLQLVNRLVDQLEGSIELDRSVGTVFKIVFACPAGEGGG